MVAPRSPIEKQSDSTNNASDQSNSETIEVKDIGETSSARAGDSDQSRFKDLTKKEVERIEGCPNGIGCCECCHIKGGPWCNCCFEFPRHPTMNQFYTPTMFSAYHREGYRACEECADFLNRSMV